MMQRPVFGRFFAAKGRLSRNFLRIAVRQSPSHLDFLPENDMRAIGAALVALTMTISSTFAADGTLTPGKPAGTKQAQIETGGVLLVAGILVAAGAIALIASTTQGNGTTSTNGTAS
jgi:hypothetical protein